MILYPLLAAFIIAADQATKYAVRTFMQPGDRIPLIGDWFSLYYVQNTGAAFSMFSGNKLVTIVLTSVLILVCLVLVLYEVRKGSKAIAVLVTMIMAGGIGNMIDRLTFGFVTDMISCWSFAVFNVADIFVTCGCIITVLYILFENKDENSASGKHDKQ